MSKAAEELARGAAREALEPLLDAACARLGAVVKRAFDIAAEQAPLQRGAGEINGSAAVSLWGVPCRQMAWQDSLTAQP